MDYVIDLAPHLVWLMGFLKPSLEAVLTFVVTVGVVWIGKKVLSFLHIKSEKIDNDRLQEFIGRGIAFALSRLGETLSNRKLEFTTKNETIALGSEYVAAGAQGILKRFGVTPERLAELVEAKLGELQAAAPVDPPVQK